MNALKTPFFFQTFKDAMTEGDFAAAEKTAQAAGNIAVVMVLQQRFGWSDNAIGGTFAECVKDQLIGCANFYY